MSCDAWFEVPPPGTELYMTKPQEEEIAEGDILTLPFGDRTYEVRVTLVRPAKFTPGKQHVRMEVVR